MATKKQQKVKKDLELITQIDEADVDLAEGLCDFIERCLRKLKSGEPLSERESAKARALQEYVQRQLDAEFSY